MSKLRNTLRAINHSEEWREMVVAACLLNGVEPTDQAIIKITHAVAGDLTLNEETLEMTFDDVSEDDIIAEAAKHGVPEESAFEALEQQVNNLSEQVLSLQKAAKETAPGFGTVER